MALKFKGTYKDLQKGRWFYTVWVALPDESKEIIQENLREIEPYCEWISTMSGNHSKDVPHISLRYLGFSDELDINEVKKEKGLFEEAISQVDDLEIELKNIGLWTREEKGEVVVARLNWEITKPKPFIDLHNALLTVPNYYLFENLERENFKPHISLGSIDMATDQNYERVKKFLEKKEFDSHKFTLKDIALNLTSPTYSEVVPLTLPK